MHILFQNLGIRRYSILGWSDGGILALIIAARNPLTVRKMVVWGANAFITEDDVNQYNGKNVLKKK